MCLDAIRTGDVNHRTVIEQVQHSQDYQYGVEVNAIPVPAYIWLRNNGIPYAETFDMVDGELRKLVWFQDQEHAVWFQLKWGGQ